MNNLNRLRLRPSQLVTYEGQDFLIAGLDGFVGEGIEGLYYRQTRFLSKMRLAVDGSEPSNVSANAVDIYSSIAYYVAPSPAGAKAGPQPGGDKGGGEMVRHGIELQINRFVGGGLHLDVHVTNHALAPTTIEVSWEFDADFADRAEAEQGERQQDAPVERRWKYEMGQGKLSFNYRHPKLSHATEIRFSGSQYVAEHEGTVSLNLRLQPQQPVSLSIDVVPIFCGEPVALQHGPDGFGNPPIDLPLDGGTQISAGNDQVQHAWDRAVSDLASLALLEGEGEERLTPAAGVPKYLALFGRDVLVTGFQAGLLAPAMLRGSLRHIAQWNAEEYDERFDQQPGRVIHQRELGPLSLLEKNPFLHYYGDYSAPGLFLIDMALDLALTGDKNFSCRCRTRCSPPSNGWIGTAMATGTDFTSTRQRRALGARRTRDGRIRARQSFTGTAGSSKTRSRSWKSRAANTQQNSFWGCLCLDRR